MPKKPTPSEVAVAVETTSLPASLIPSLAPTPTLRPFKLKAGNMVTVYVDPITRLVAEGPAKLICPVNDEPEADGMERWFVRFGNAPGSYQRRIMPLTAEPTAAEPAPVAAEQPAVTTPAEEVE